MLHSAQHAKLLHDVAKKIDTIKNTIKEIHERRLTYDIPESSNSNNNNNNNDRQSPATLTKEEDRARLLHNQRRNVEEKDVVGFALDSEAIINDLMEGSRRKVVSIIGMGGLGKTTLAKKVYNNNRVEMHFNCRVWVYVSNECRAKELLLRILKHLMLDTEYQSTRRSNKEKDMARDFSNLSEHELKEKVREFLKRKRYLLVLDDLWKNQDWDEVQDAFPDNNQGSKILITSRLKEVALHTSHDQSPPHYLPFLTEEQGWQLFSTKVFKGEDFPSNLEPLGKGIVKGCRGLPLSIVVIAGLLANKDKSQREWSRVADHVNWYVTKDETQVKDIALKLSFDDLPTRLKPGFLYLGIFPVDFEIHVRQLLEQWVAEGFIQETRSRDPNDVAEDYLYELIDRSLIQIVLVKTNGHVKICRVHDLLRDLCISESKEDKFFEVCMNSGILIPTKPRRLSIQCSMFQYASSSSNDHSSVRSLFCFDSEYYADHKEWIWLSKGFKLVRVLDLTGSCCTKVPSSLGDFIHLRYLRIQSKNISSIPDSICSLQNLETLHLQASDNGHSVSHSVSFPSDIWKLKLLRNLHASRKKNIMLRGQHSKSSEVMWNIQTLNSIRLNRQAASFIEKRVFPKLRDLGLIIYPDHEVNIPKVLLSLQHLDHLNKLKIYILVTSESTSKKIGSSKPQELVQNLERLIHLSVLKIYAHDDLLTGATWFPPNITTLTLHNVKDLNGAGMIALGNLTKLQHLSLWGDLNMDNTLDIA